MKFTINAKELKTMMNKVMTVVDKKASLGVLQYLYFTAQNGMLRILCTNIEHYLEIRTGNVYNIEEGDFVIDLDDVKVMSKMSGEITMESVDEHSIAVKNGKKSITIHQFENDVDIKLPEITTKTILAVKENWLLKTIINLQPFVCDDESKSILCAYHFNLNANRVETVDGYKLGIKTLNNQKVYNTEENIKLHKMCIPIIRKILNNKATDEVTFAQNDKYIKMSGKDFTYIVRQLEGKYFNVEQAIPTESNCMFVVNRENMLEVMKYNMDIAKNARIPVVLHSRKGVLYAYEKTGKYVIYDEIATIENTMKDDFYMGFNPKYLADVFSVVDTDTPVCECKNALSPLVITGDEYKFIVCPNRLEEDMKNMVRQYIQES